MRVGLDVGSTTIKMCIRDRYMANRNITTLDAGVPVLAMHAPFEVVAKLDCYETYKGMKAVYEAE